MKTFTLRVELKDSSAFLLSDDGAILLHLEASAVSKRFHAAERVLYFHACVAGGILDIGDRLPESSWTFPIALLPPKPKPIRGWQPPEQGRCACGKPTHQGLCARAAA